jgi:hypothetical protein
MVLKPAARRTGITAETCSTITAETCSTAPLLTLSALLIDL